MHQVIVMQGGVIGFDCTYTDPHPQMLFSTHAMHQTDGTVKGLCWQLSIMSRL